MRSDPLRRHEQSLASSDWSSRPAEPAAGKRTVAQALEPYQPHGGATQLEQARQRMAVLESTASGDDSAAGWQLASVRQALRDAEEEAADAQHDDRRGEIAELRARLSAIETRASENPTHVVAARGVRGATEALPFVDVIQRAFGRHDVGRVRARVSGDAADASAAIGARAYAFGDRVAFAVGPDLHTAAHEAAHVLQQRAGLGPASGVGSSGDRHEAEADLIADAVVSGRSAEALIDQMIARGGGARAATVAVQRDDRTGKTSVAPAPRAPDGAGYALSEAAGELRTAREVITTCTTILVPAFRRAVDAIDPAGAIQLAQAAVNALAAASGGFARATERAAAGDPHARTQCEPGAPPDMTPISAAEIDEAASLRAEVDGLGRQLHGLERHMLISMSPQVFRDRAVLGSCRIPPGAETNALEAVIRESSTTVDLLVTFQRVRELLGADPANASADAKHQAVDAIQMWRSRPANFRFLYDLLAAEDLLDVLHDISGSSHEVLRKTHGAVLDQARATGNFADVGTWDAAKVDDLLSRGVTDWAITDDDAEDVLDMVASAAPTARGKLILQLESTGTLGAMCDNLPWRRVKELHDVLDDRAARAALRPHFQHKGGGESLSKVYEDKIMDALEDDRYVSAFLWTFLDTAHDGLTFGFKGAHDAAYDASEEGWISDDAYLSTTAKAAARSAAVMAVTMATGAVGGSWGEGIAQVLGAGRTTAQILGGAAGGATAGVTGLATSDAYNQLFMGQNGWSSLSDYGHSALMGCVTGALTAGVQAAGSKFLPTSAKSMSQTYAERYPELDNILTRIRNSGVRKGLTLKVTAQEMDVLLTSPLLDVGTVADALGRIRAVRSNSRIDVETRTLSKIYPQSQIEQFYGDVDATTGDVSVRSDTPSIQGYVADADSIPASSRTTNDALRERLGLDGDRSLYAKYDNPNDPLFEVTVETSVELDVPLPQEAGPNASLGRVDWFSHHRAGTGLTQGGVPEGTLPAQAPIRILDISPVGTPRTSYPRVSTKPFSPVSAVPSVRGLGAPVSGSISDAGVCALGEDQ
ncbi:MAG TPA: DUF4157 domain-containing protein [Kofleriaceae bacterium]|nr:DUF4157 domain-containing protein [Kofleriaceae bacterium]